VSKNIVWGTLFILVAGILQSTLLSKLLIHFNIVPDIALDILVFCAYANGTMTGQLTGFFSGLLLDFLSAAPLGMNLFIRTVIGALAGLIRGAFILDAVFLPVILCVGATLLKAGLLLLLHFLFAGTIPTYSFTSHMLWFELFLNALLAPFLFALLKTLSSLLVNPKNQPF
jgi:rod shape-determining protein MreD